MPEPSDVSPARPPLQARSRRTLARIVEASRTLIAERGREGLTVQDVVARARVSVGSFYARFSGRDELLRYLDLELTARERARWQAELAVRLDGEAGVAARVRAIVDLLAGSTAALSAESHRELRSAAAAVVLADPGEIGHPEPGAAVALAYAATLGVLADPPGAWRGPRLADELVRLWLGYLAGPAEPADARDRAGVDFFDVWV